jgi:hypothetical protein
MIMSQFRAYCLDEQNAIIAGQDVEAPDLPSAIRAAQTICALQPKGCAERIEIWQGTQRLYTSAS